MITVNMEKIDRAIHKMRQGIIKCALDQTRKAAVFGVVVTTERVEHVLTVKASLFIPLPRINGIAARIDVQVLYGLTKRTVRIAVLCSQFDDEGRPQDIDQQHGKWDVLVPGGEASEAIGPQQADRMV